jgi:hypothetical protein
VTKCVSIALYSSWITGLPDYWITDSVRVWQACRLRDFTTSVTKCVSIALYSSWITGLPDYWITDSVRVWQACRLRDFTTSVTGAFL